MAAWHGLDACLHYGAVSDPRAFSFDHPRRLWALYADWRCLRNQRRLGLRNVFEPHGPAIADLELHCGPAFAAFSHVNGATLWKGKLSISDIRCSHRLRFCLCRLMHYAVSGLRLSRIGAHSCVKLIKLCDPLCLSVTQLELAKSKTWLYKWSCPSWWALSSLFFHFRCPRLSHTLVFTSFYVYGDQAVAKACPSCHTDKVRPHICTSKMLHNKVQ